MQRPDMCHELVRYIAFALFIASTNLEALAAHAAAPISNETADADIRYTILERMQRARDPRCEISRDEELRAIRQQHKTFVDECGGNKDACALVDGLSVLELEESLTKLSLPTPC